MSTVKGSWYRAEALARKWDPRWIFAYQNGFASCVQNKAVDLKRKFFFAKDRNITQIAGLEKHLPIVAQDGFEFVCKAKVGI